MDLRYRVRYTRGQTEIIIESNDKAYIDEKLEELGATPASKPAKKASAPRERSAADLADILNAMRTASNSHDVQTHAIDKRNRVGRILACFYFAHRAGQRGLTTREVETLTHRMGKEIAQPNVGKVIRLGARKYLTELAAASGSSVYRINKRGRTAFESLVRGGPLL